MINDDDYLHCTCDEVVLALAGTQASSHRECKIDGDQIKYIWVNSPSSTLFHSRRFYCLISYLLLVIRIRLTSADKCMRPSDKLKNDVQLIYDLKNILNGRNDDGIFNFPSRENRSSDWWWKLCTTIRRRLNTFPIVRLHLMKRQKMLNGKSIPSNFRHFFYPNDFWLRTRNGDDMRLSYKLSNI